MIKRTLTSAERALLILLALIIVAGAYYLLVHKSVVNSLEDIESQKEMVQTQLQVAQTKNMKMKKMQDELAAIKESGSKTTVPEYDNLSKDILFLNTVLAGTSDYTINFASVTTSNNIVRRVCNISFTSSSYNASCTIIKLLQNCKYCCRLGDVSMNPIREYDSGYSYDYNYDADYSIITNPLTVNVSLTYYERVVE